MTAAETTARIIQSTVNVQTPTTDAETFSRSEIETRTETETKTETEPEIHIETDANASVGTLSNSASTKAVIVTAPALLPVEFTENFYITNRRKSNIKIQVKLSGSGIYLRRETEEQNIISEQLLRVEDIIGSRFGTRLKKRARGGLASCQRSVQTQENEGETNSGSDLKKDTSAYLYIYAYIKSEKSGASRHRTVRILRFRSNDRFEENLKSAERWYRGIQTNKGLACGAMATLNDDVLTKPYLILLNPKSGSGKSRELFQKHVVPVLKEVDIPYELQITTRANYARELVRSRKDLETTYRGIVVASGDGLFYEVLNGLMERTDWRNVCSKLPMGIIPCGSGNGLARSIAYLYNEPYEPKPILYATLSCISGYTAPMDIVRVELGKPGAKPVQMYSFLSVGWGLIADIDIESERLRSIGAQRFTIWTIHRLISLRTYKGKLSYLPWERNQCRTESEEKTTMARDVEKTEIKSSKPIEVEEKEEEEDGTNGFYDALDIDDENAFVDATSLDGSNFRSHVGSWNSTTSKRTAYYSIADQSVRSRRSLTASILNKLETIGAAIESLKSDPPATTIPPLNMPLPDDTWSSEEGEFIMVHAAYTTHLATDCFFAPKSRLSDGIIYLVIIRAGCSRSQLLQFLLGMSTGTHIPCTPNEYIQVVPVRAFRIEPFGDDGIMAVDGERVDFGSIQAEILPGMIDVMVPSASTI